MLSKAFNVTYCDQVGTYLDSSDMRLRPDEVDLRTIASVLVAP